MCCAIATRCLASQHCWLAPCSGTVLRSTRGKRDQPSRRTQPAAESKQGWLPRPLRCQASNQAEGPLQGLAELFGATGDDPGHWNFSPEWWGNQGGSWGRNAGVTVFAATSQCGNGHITVTAHPATPKGSSPVSEASWEEWRVLRFNGVTRQSVARVRVQPAAPGVAAAAGSSSTSQQVVVAQPDCLAQEYLKTAAAVTAALLGLQHLCSPAASSSGSNGGGSSEAGGLRALCIGVGGGSLPLFLAHHFPNMGMDAVELDPAVVVAATLAMGLPTTLPNLRLHIADAAAYLAERCRQQQGQAPLPYDFVFMDAFDGADDVPAELCTPEFVGLVASALHPRHGCFLLNLHSIEDKATIAAFKAALLRGQGCTRGGSSSSADGGGGSCFAVRSQQQNNQCVVVARGLQLPAWQEAEVLRRAAVEVAAAAGYRFPAWSRACKDYQSL